MFVVACDAAVGNSCPSTTKSYQFYTVISLESTLTSTLTNSVTESQPPLQAPPEAFPRFRALVFLMWVPWPGMRSSPFSRVNWVHSPDCSCVLGSSGKPFLRAQVDARSLCPRRASVVAAALRFLV